MYADPLAQEEGNQQADGFELKVGEVSPHGDWASVKLVVTRPSTSNTAGVRFYLHPTTYPPILDVPFIKDQASLSLDIWGASTVLCQVEGGPRLKLDLANQEAIPDAIRKR